MEICGSSHEAVYDAAYFSTFTSGLSPKRIVWWTATTITTEMASNVLYNRLPSNERRIRLLTITPNLDQSASLECGLDEFDLDAGSTRYDALSYCWGDPRITAPVLINGHNKLVTANLDISLRQLRSNAYPKPIVIWADALCINQGDVEERGRQVQLMAEIYAKASTVHAWLGTGNALEREGLKLIERWSRCPCLGTKRTTRCHIVGPPLYTSPTTQFIRDLHALASVCQSPYWGRLWMVQELAWNDNVLLHCGRYCGSVTCWERLGVRLQRYGTADVRTAASVKAHPSTGVQEAACGAFPNAGFAEFKNGCPSSSTGRLRVLECMRPFAGAKQHVFAHRSGRPTNVLVKATFAFLYLFLCENKTSDPRDRIYATLGLVGKLVDTRVDYSRTTADVYEDATFAIMKSTNSTDILQFAATGNSIWPTWAANFESSHNPRSRSYPRDYGQELLTFDSYPLNRYAPSRPIRSVLKLQGRLVGTITKVQILPGQEFRIAAVQQKHPLLVSRAFAALWRDLDGEVGGTSAAKIKETFHTTCFFTTANGFHGRAFDAVPRVGDLIYAFALPSTRFHCLRPVESPVQLAHELIGPCAITNGLKESRGRIGPLAYLQDVVKSRYGGDWLADGLFHSVLLI